MEKTKNKYQYKGDTEVFVPGLGLVIPGQIVETNLEINNPKFEVITKVKKEK